MGLRKVGLSGSAGVVAIHVDGHGAGPEAYPEEFHLVVDDTAMLSGRVPEVEELASILSGSVAAT